MIELDGSEGEGGGQILRTALTLSLMTGRAIRIRRIRSKRTRPGLLRQHLTAVRAATAVGQAIVQGDTVGSLDLFFDPKTIVPDHYKFSVGTAGSAMLVLQTVLPALFTAKGVAEIEVEGGTHNPASPPFDFLERVYVPLMAKMGPKMTATLERPGFYPAGGGRVRVRVEPVEKLAPLHLTERGAILRRRLVSRVAGLPGHIAERQIATFLEHSGWPAETAEREVLDASYGPGNVLLAFVDSEGITEIVSGFGEKGVRAEIVGKQVAEEVSRYIAHGAPVGEHLADQLLLPMALAGEGSFVSGPLSLHTQTQIETIKRFLPVEVTQVPEGEQRVKVRVERR
ncbi:MAG: RNA 3'-terminal phosphate cyclase [Myxococcota bacterium]